MRNLSFEIIGDIVIIRDTADKVVLKNFAKEKMKKHPYLKSAVLQTSKIQGKKRIRSLETIQGKQSFETTHREHGCVYQMNLLQAFFSPRLSFERQRISNLVTENEIVLNFFSGVGPFSIAIASKQKECIVHSIEINEIAYRYLCQNILLNNMQNRVFPYLGDAFEIVQNNFINKVDRILLPLPLESQVSLPIACRALKNRNGIIHWQITEHMESKTIPLQEIKTKIQSIFTESEMEVNYDLKTVKVIRWIAPRIAHIAVDLSISDFE